MYRNDNEALRRQFAFGSQGYNIVRCLVFMYALKKCDINYNNYYGPEDAGRPFTPDKYMSYLHGLIKDNLDVIDNKIGHPLSYLVRDCSKYFDVQYITGSGLTSAMIRASHMSSDEIVKFIVEEATTIGIGKEDYSTPETLSKLVIGLLHSKENEKWYDLGCSNGDFLLNVNSSLNNVRLYGSDINYEVVLLARIRLFFAGASSLIERADSIYSPLFKNEIDCAFGNFPLAYRLNGIHGDYNSLNKFVLPVPIKRNLDWIFIDRLLQTLNKNGRAIAVVANGTLSNSLDLEQRKQAIESNIIEGIISLPGRLFNYTMIPTSLIIFNLNKTNKFIKILDATSMCNEGRRINELKVDEIINAYNNSYREISIEKARDNYYSLLVSTYSELDDIKFENEKTIDDVALEVFRGYQFTADQLDEGVNEEQEEYRVISVGDLQDGSYYYDKLQKVSIDQKRAKKFAIQNGDILVSARATTLKISIAEITDEKIVASGSIIVIRCDRSKINPVYLKAFLDSNIGHKLISSIQSGTGIISLNANAIRKIRFPMADIELQEEISMKYLKAQDMLKVTRIKLEKLENQLSNLFDESMGGVDIA